MTSELSKRRQASSENAMEGTKWMERPAGMRSGMPCHQKQLDTLIAYENL